MKVNNDMMTLVLCMVSGYVVLHKMQLALLIELMLKLQKQEADIIAMIEEKSLLKKKAIILFQLKYLNKPTHKAKLHEAINIA